MLYRDIYLCYEISCCFESAVFQQFESQKANINFYSLACFLLEASRNETHIYCLATKISNMLGTLKKKYSVSNVDLHPNLKRVNTMEEREK